MNFLGLTSQASKAQLFDCSCSKKKLTVVLAKKRKRGHVAIKDKINVGIIISFAAKVMSEVWPLRQWVGRAR